MSMPATEPESGNVIEVGVFCFKSCVRLAVCGQIWLKCWGTYGEVKLKMYQISANFVHRDLRSATLEGKKMPTSITLHDPDVNTREKSSPESGRSWRLAGGRRLPAPAAACSRCRTATGSSSSAVTRRRRARRRPRRGSPCRTCSSWPRTVSEQCVLCDPNCLGSFSNCSRT